MYLYCCNILKNNNKRKANTRMLETVIQEDSTINYNGISIKKKIYNSDNHSEVLYKQREHAYLFLLNR